MNIISKKKSKNIEFNIWLKRTSKKFFWFLKKRIKAVSIILILIFLWVSFSFIVNNTVLSDVNIIKVIKFNNENLKKVDDPLLYNDIMTHLKNKNFFMVNYLWIWNFKQEIKNSYEVIEDIKLYKTQDNTVYVDIKFYKPSLIFNNTMKKIWVYRWHFFDISTGSSFLTWEIIIDLPDYTKDWVFTWFFFKINENTLKFQVDQIVKTFWKKYIKNVFYIPWAWKIIVTLSDEKKIYFDGSKNVWEQLNKFLMFQNSYLKFNDLKEIDLWSIDDVIVK